MTLPFGPLLSIKELEGSGWFIMSLITNGSNKYLVMVNQNFSESRKLLLEFDSSYNGSTYSTKDGTIPDIGGFTGVFSFEPGECKVIKYK